MSRLFRTGRLLLSREASQRLTTSDVLDLIHRHVTGDWGDLTPEDKVANDQALRRGLRILSAYRVEGRKWWVITEADRSATTVLSPEEY